MPYIIKTLQVSSARNTSDSFQVLKSFLTITCSEIFTIGKYFVVPTFGYVTPYGTETKSLRNRAIDAE